MAWSVVGTLAAAKLLVHLYVLRGYGIFRDELYYLACADRLDWGYVDHPALSALVLKVWTAVLGDGLLAIRLLPALSGVATLVLTAATAREMGGRRYAQALAAAAVLVAPYYLAINHIYSMNALTLLAWAAAAWLIARLARSADQRTWIALGVVLALGLANKIDVLWLGAGLGLGLLLDRERRWLATPGPWIAGTIAMIGLLPYVVWNAAHGWPTREFMANATTQKMAVSSAVDFASNQVLLLHPLTLPLSLAGLAYLLFHGDGRRFRLLAWIFLGTLAILLSLGSSRPGYLAPAYIGLFAAGAVATEKLLTRWDAQRLAYAGVVALLIGGAITAPLAVPVLSVDGYIDYAARLGVAPGTDENKVLAQLPQFYADMHGWREIARTAISVADTLPAEHRGRVVVFAPDYGVAGAIERFGREHGLVAVSGHNNYWFWGPGEFDGSAMIVIGGSGEDLAPLFESVELAARTDCGHCMPYENGLPVWLCRNALVDLASVWPGVKHFD
jgi:hypothetical protein